MHRGRVENNVQDDSLSDLIISYPTSSPNTECCSLACLEMIDEDNLRDQHKMVDVGVKFCGRR